MKIRLSDTSGMRCIFLSFSAASPTAVTSPKTVSNSDLRFAFEDDERERGRLQPNAKGRYLYDIHIGRGREGGFPKQS